MAGRTNTDSIRELEKHVAVLQYQLGNANSRVTELDDDQATFADRLNVTERKIAIVEVQLTELKRSLEESDRKRWQLTVGLILAFVGLLVNLALALWRR